MNYETGFALCVVLACVVALIFALWVSCRWTSYYSVGENDENQHVVCDDEHPCKFKIYVLIFLLFLGGSVSLIVWGSSARADTNMDKADALAAIIFGAVIFTCIIPCFLIGFWKRPYRNIIFLSVYCLLLPGLIVLAIAYQKLQFSELYQETSLLIDNSRVEYDHDIRCRNGGVCEGFQGQLLVSWDCPNSSSCTTWITDPSCVRFTREHESTLPYGRERTIRGRSLKFLESDTSAILKVENCLEQSYDGISFAYGAMYATPWEEGEPRPRIDKVYTSCSSCSAILAIPQELGEAMKPVGIGMSIAGASMIILVVAILAVHAIYENTKSKSSIRIHAEEERRRPWDDMEIPQNVGMETNTKE